MDRGRSSGFSDVGTIFGVHVSVFCENASFSMPVQFILSLLSAKRTPKKQTEVDLLVLVSTSTSESKANPNVRMRLRRSRMFVVESSFVPRRYNFVENDVSGVLNFCSWFPSCSNALFIVVSIETVRQSKNVLFMFFVIIRLAERERQNSLGFKFNSSPQTTRHHAIVEVQD